MAMEICLNIADDGSMTIEAGEKEETPEMESAEGGQKTPVASIDEALALIKQMAESASMAPPPEQAPAPETETPAEDAAPMEEEEAMGGSFQARR